MVLPQQLLQVTLVVLMVQVLSLVLRLLAAALTQQMVMRVLQQLASHFLHPRYASPA